MPAKFFEQEVKAKLKDRRRLSAFLDNLVAQHRKEVKKVQLTYIFCTEDFLLQMNKQYLDHDTDTDIITFDLGETALETIGEIYISTERVKENAAKYAVSYNDELHRVIFHGALHLCGFKDKKEQEQKVMRENEDICLEAYKRIGTIMNIEKLYEDDDLLIVNKPAGLLVIPDRFNNELPSLNRLLEAKAGQKIWVVHRLDRDTSGVICFAKNEQAHRYLSILFQERGINKYYAGLVTGTVIPNEGRIESPIAEHPAANGKMVVSRKGKVAVTDYKVAEQWPLYALMQFQIHTGRTHQIRVHMQSIGHPIVCDELYGDGQPFLLSNIKRKYRLSEKDEQEKPLLSRLALHAYKLEFVKEDGTPVTAEATLPRDMAACMKQLAKWGPKPQADLQ